MIRQVKKTATVMLIIFGLLVIGFQCKKECNSDNTESVDDPEYDYNFIVDMNVSPLQKVYSIGDTINLSFEISNNTLYDSKSQTDIELGNVKGNEIQFEMFFGTPQAEVPLPPLTDTSPKNFLMITDQSDIVQTSSLSLDQVSADIPCELFSDTFRFDLKLIPLNSGIFSMFQLRPLFPERLVQFNSMGNCNENLNDFQTGDMSYKFVDNNPELLEELFIPCDANPVRGLEQRTDERYFFWMKVE